MQLGKNRAERGAYVAALLILTLAVFLSGTLQTRAQESGEITFVRLANGAPGGEGIYIINADGSGERPLLLFEDIGLPYDIVNGGYRCPVWSPDGAQLALNGVEGNTNYIAVVDVESVDVRRVYEVEQGEEMLHNIYFPEWVPGTNQLSFGFLEAERFMGVIRENGIRVVDLDSGEVVTLKDDVDLVDENGTPRYLGDIVPNYAPFSHSWSPDGDQLALTLYNWRTFLLDADGSNLREVPAQWANGDVEWSPDGSTLAISLYRMILVDPDNGSERELVPVGETLNGSTVESLAWSPDGSEIAYSTMWIDIVGGEFTTAFSLSVVDVATGEIRELVRTPSFTYDYPYNISCVDWRPAAQN